MDAQKALTTAHTVPATAGTLHAIGNAANAAAAQSELERYQGRKTAQTLRRQKADVALFARFLVTSQGEPGEQQQLEALASTLALWSGVTYGLIEAFSLWQLQQGYAIGSINVRLATVKTYCELASRAGYIPGQDLALIKSVKGYRQSEGRNVDAKRAAAGTRTRTEQAKKGEPVSIGEVHASLLKQQDPATRKGRRDALLMCLLLDHGLRCGEVAALDLSSLNLGAGTLTFYRHKVDLTQVHNLTPDTFRAAQTYLSDVLPEQGPLFIGLCSKARIDERSINHRVEVLGHTIGLENLSPHDCRHYWATHAIRCGTDVKSLQDAGGWSSPAMPLRYAESSKIANEGVKLTRSQK